MALTKYKLGDLIEQCDDRNSDGVYSLDDVKGISIQKIFIDKDDDQEEKEQELFNMCQTL